MPKPLLLQISRTDQSFGHVFIFGHQPNTLLITSDRLTAAPRATRSHRVRFAFTPFNSLSIWALRGAGVCSVFFRTLKQCSTFHCQREHSIFISHHSTHLQSSMISSLLQHAAVVLFSLSSIFMLIFNRQGCPNSANNARTLCVILQPHGTTAVHSQYVALYVVSPPPRNRMVSRSCLSIDAM